MADKIQIRRDLSGNWTTANPILAQGEFGYELDTGRIKIGDGATDWNTLSYKFESTVVEGPVGTFTFTDEQGNTISWTEGSSGVTDHGALSGLADDDHLQYLTETRHDALPFDNPHNVDKTQVGLGNVPNVDATDRTNHIGTQLSSTISDFATAVQTNETVTNLQIIGNTLRYTNESGIDQDIDLTPYLDDTNLARLVSGTIDGVTGIATFTRDDATTFDVDFSPLFDDTNLARIVSGTFDNITKQITLTRDDTTNFDIDLSSLSTVDVIDDLSDVDTTTNTPIINDMLTWDGTNWTPQSIENGYTIFPIWAEESANISSGQREWSFGNGATSTNGITIPIGCEVFALSYQAVTNTTGTASIDIMINDVITQTTAAQGGTDWFETFDPVVTVNTGDVLGFRTNTVAGTQPNNVRVCAWFRVLSSAATTMTLNDLADTDVTGAVAGEVLQYDGTEWRNVVLGGGGGVTDHGALTGLADDDHPQYLNETRGDVRYYTKTEIDSQQLVQDTNVANLTTTDISEGANLYFTNTRAQNASVINSMAGNETNQAPSVDSVKTYVSSQVSDEIFQATNTDTGSGLANDPNNFTTTLPIVGTSTIINDQGSFTAFGNQGITINFTGHIEISCNVHIISDGQRSAIQARFRKNNVEEGPIAGTGYIRNSTGHQESSLHLNSYIMAVSPGDQITIGIKRESTNTGYTRMAQIGSSSITARRVK